MLFTVGVLFNDNVALAMYFYVTLTHLLLFPFTLSRLSSSRFLLLTLFVNLTIILTKHANKTPSVNQASSSGLLSLVIRLYLPPP